MFLGLCRMSVHVSYKAEDLSDTPAHALLGNTVLCPCAKQTVSVQN